MSYSNAVAFWTLALLFGLSVSETNYVVIFARKRLMRLLNDKVTNLFLMDK